MADDMFDDEEFDNFSHNASDDDDDEDVVDSEEDEPVADEVSHAYKPFKLQRSKSFEVLDKSELQTEQQRMIKETMDVLGLSNHAAATALLASMKWNKEKLIERYMENSDKVFADAGIPQVSMENPATNPAVKHSCLICLEENSASQTYALACGHRYCLDCWRSYLQLKIGEGCEAISAKCPAPKCSLRVHEDAYQKIVDPALFKKYSNFLVKSYVEENPLCKWCCAPGCDFSIRCETKDRKDAVTCRCGFKFCFSCCDFDIGDHMPSTCEQIDRWREKASFESENVKWMLSNTKKCPECRSPIEKNGGCMHMTCKKNGGGCGYEFCWLCRGPWSEHGNATGGYYSCNKYDKSKVVEEDKADSKSDLETYMFYYHRYESHMNAMKIALEQKKNVEKKEEDLQEKFKVRSADTKYLNDAIEQLIQNRRVLQFSYVYGYYLDRKSQERNLFEYLQEDLEKHTNELSGLYETTIEKIADTTEFFKWKEEVTNYSRITKKFLDNFVRGVSGGLVSAP